MCIGFNTKSSSIRLELTQTERRISLGVEQAGEYMSSIRFIKFPRSFSRGPYVEFVELVLFEPECPVVILHLRIRTENGKMEVHRTRIRLSDNALLEGVVGVPQCLATVKRRLPVIRRFIRENQTA